MNYIIEIIKCWVILLFIIKFPHKCTYNMLCFHIDPLIVSQNLSFFVFFYQLFGPHPKETRSSPLTSGSEPGKPSSFGTQVINYTCFCEFLFAVGSATSHRSPRHTLATQASSALQIMLYVAIVCILLYNYVWECVCGM